MRTRELARRAKFGIRLDPAGPEAHCIYCDEYYPLTIEFWAVKRNRVFTLDRCRLCNRERGRLYQALRRADPEFRESERVRHGNYYRTWIAKNEPQLLDVWRREQMERERIEARGRRKVAA